MNGAVGEADTIDEIWTLGALEGLGLLFETFGTNKEAEAVVEMGTVGVFGVVEFVAGDMGNDIAEAKEGKNMGKFDDS